MSEPKEIGFYYRATDRGKYEPVLVQKWNDSFVFSWAGSAHMLGVENDGRWGGPVPTPGDIEKYRDLAHHLRHCVECGATDITECFEGLSLWMDCIGKPDPEATP